MIIPFAVTQTNMYILHILLYFLIFLAAVESVLKAFESGIYSDNIQQVVDGYEHAMLSLMPRARYVIGKDAKFLWLPLQSLPEWLGDLILEKSNKDRPIPAALKKR